MDSAVLLRRFFAAAGSRVVAARLPHRTKRAALRRKTSDTVRAEIARKQIGRIGQLSRQTVDRESFRQLVRPLSRTDAGHQRPGVKGAKDAYSVRGIAVEDSRAAITGQGIIRDIVLGPISPERAHEALKKVGVVR
jgi:hypothetical protein